MKKQIAIIGGGPAGLMAAEVLASAGHAVTIYDHKPSLGRKFLMAGRGGLNLTHSEPLDKFMPRYGSAAAALKPAIDKFPPAALRQWCEDLGQETFVGSSGRVFPKAMKASPLLRAWSQRLEKLGVQVVYNKSWLGWENDALKFADGSTVKADAVLLALGGASWPRLGSDGSWVDILKKEHIDISPLRPANSGFTVNWSEVFRNKFAGTPLKPIGLTFQGKSFQGEAMITAAGIEGSAIYALSAEAIAKDGKAVLHLDLRPGVSADSLMQRLEIPSRGKSFSEYMRKEAGLSPVATSLLREANNAPAALSPYDLIKLIKSLPITLLAPFAIDRAISTAGGISFSEIDTGYMLKKKPGVFVAGEMLDWEAPTGGYLLQAVFSTAVAAAEGIKASLA